MHLTFITSGGGRVTDTFAVKERRLSYAAFIQSAYSMLERHGIRSRRLGLRVIDHNEWLTHETMVTILSGLRLLVREVEIHVYYHDPVLYPEPWTPSEDGSPVASRSRSTQTAADTLPTPFVPPSPVPKPRVLIALCGLIGCGKTEFGKFLKKLAERQGLLILFIDEPVDSWEPWLQTLYRSNPQEERVMSDIKEKMLWLETMALWHHKDAVQKGDVPRVVARSQLDCRHVFIPLLKRRGMLSEAHVEQLDMLLKQEWTTPDIHIVIGIEIAEALRRIQVRGRESEQTIPEDYLEDMDHLYKEGDFPKAVQDSGGYLIRVQSVPNNDGDEGHRQLLNDIISELDRPNAGDKVDEAARLFKALRDGL